MLKFPWKRAILGGEIRPFILPKNQLNLFRFLHYDEEDDDTKGTSTDDSQSNKKLLALFDTIVLLEPLFELSKLPKFPWKRVNFEGGKSGHLLYPKKLAKKLISVFTIFETREMVL